MWEITAVLTWLFGKQNAVPDDHFQDLPCLIQAASGRPTGSAWLCPCCTAGASTAASLNPGLRLRGCRNCRPWEFQYCYLWRPWLGYKRRASDGLDNVMPCIRCWRRWRENPGFKAQPWAFHGGKPGWRHEPNIYYASVLSRSGYVL